MPNETSTDQLDLLTATLKVLEDTTGSQLSKFHFTPTFIEGRLTKVEVTLKYDPMMEEN